MRRTTGIAAVLVFIMGGAVAHAENTELAKLFSDRGVTGTLVIQSKDGSTSFVHNEARADKRFLPASTFKIPNSLIALQENIIADENDIIPWDGKDRGWEKWNRDQCMATALPISCVWFYQELARRVGNERYLSWLKKLNYGNRKTGPAVDTFWLDGDLAINAHEQIRFLRAFEGDTDPFDPEIYRIVKRLLIVEQTDSHTIRAKTGWALRKGPGIGWYVGYVETDEQVWFFAMNMDIPKSEDAKYRQEIVMAALKAKGIIQE